MQIIKLTKKLKLPKSVIALGFFDGVHLGHKRVIQTAKGYAGLLGVKSLVFTFRDLPRNKVKGVEKQKLILKFEDKVNAIKNLGIDYLVWADFNKKFSEISPYDFVKEILVKILCARIVVAGYNYRFGHKAQGNIKYLEKLSREFGFKVDVIKPVTIGGSIVSSTLARNFICAGALKKAADLLGCRFGVKTNVVTGKGLGKKLKIHTANMHWPRGIIAPPAGVYAVFVEYDGQIYKGAANFGYSPTFAGRRGLINQPPTLETHIFNFNKNIYKEKLEVHFVKKIRDEIKFNNVEDLIKQIKEDIKKAKRILE